MSLPGAMTAYAEFVAQVLVSECGRNPPTRVLRYFGERGLPQDCCTTDGVLSVTTWNGWATETFPNDAGGRASESCSSRPVYPLRADLDVCWRQPKVSSSGIEILDDAWDADAAELAATLDCVARAIMCPDKCAAEASRDKWAAYLEELVNGRDTTTAFVSARVVGPSGGCVRLSWLVYASPAREVVS